MQQPRVVIVTGASSGIGAVTARMLAEQGDVVVTVARNDVALKAAAEESTQLHPAPDDVLDADRMTEIVQSTVAPHGRVDAVVHAAQVMAYGRIEDVPVEVFDQHADLRRGGQLRRAARGSAAAGPRTRTRRKGRPADARPATPARVGRPAQCRGRRRLPAAALGLRTDRRTAGGPGALPWRQRRAVARHVFEPGEVEERPHGRWDLAGRSGRD